LAHAGPSRRLASRRRRAAAAPASKCIACSAHVVRLLVASALPCWCRSCGGEAAVPVAALTSDLVVVARYKVSGTGGGPTHHSSTPEGECRSAPNAQGPTTWVGSARHELIDCRRRGAAVIGSASPKCAESARSPFLPITGDYKQRTDCTSVQVRTF
jgi:hypothetical protein